MSPRYLCLAALMAFPVVVLGQTGYSVTGGLSNFDCGNHTDEDCDEFEIEIENCRPEDVYHTYRNGNYGTPSVTLEGTYTRINYHSPAHLTSRGAIEHFGVSVRSLSALGAIRVQWRHAGHIATVNGQIPNPGGGTAPATQPILPSIAVDTTYTGTGEGALLSVTNNDPSQFIWVKRSAKVVAGTVTLEQLMTNNPVVISSGDIDTAPFLLGPGQTASTTSDFLEAEDLQTAVFSAGYYQNIPAVGPFGGSDLLSVQLGTVMTASTASNFACSFYSPVIRSQPQSVDAPAGHSADLRVDADANDFPISYQWLKEGLPVTDGPFFSGATTDNLTVEELNGTTEGFYAVRLSNSCGETISDAALVFITGHNVAPPQPPAACPCVADFDASGGTPDASDIDAFFGSWLAGDPTADSDCSGGTPDASDIDMFFNQWLAGGC